MKRTIASSIIAIAILAFIVILPIHQGSGSAAASDPSIGPVPPFYFSSQTSQPQWTSINSQPALQLTPIPLVGGAYAGAAWHALNYAGQTASVSLDGTYTQTNGFPADGFTLMLFAQSGTGSLSYANNSIPGTTLMSINHPSCGYPTITSSTGIQGTEALPLSTTPYLALQWDPFYGLFGSSEFNLWLMNGTSCSAAANPGGIGCSIGVPAAKDTISFSMNYTSSSNALGAQVADITSGTNCSFNWGLSPYGFAPPSPGVYWAFAEGNTGGFSADWTLYQVTVLPETNPIQKSFTLLSPSLPTSQTFVPLGTTLTWRVDYTIANIFNYPMTSVILKDYFAASLAADTTTITFSAPPGSGASAPVFSTKTGNQPQWFLTWSIATLQPGQTATLSVNVHTTINPKGNQGFTQPGLEILNSGATVKWIPPGLPMQSFETLPVSVMAGNTVGAVIGIVTSGGTGIGSTTVTLSLGTSLVGTAQTSSLGFYEFDALTRGIYTISTTTATGTATASLNVASGTVTTQNLST